MMNPLALVEAIAAGLARGWVKGKAEAERMIKEIEVIGGSNDVREDVIDAVDNAPSADE